MTKTKSNVKSVTYKAGEYLFREKDPSNTLFIVQEGQIQIFKSQSDGTKIPLAVVNSGEYLGELAVLSGQVHSASAVSLTEVAVLKISRASIEAQLKSAPQWLVALTIGLVKRLRLANEVLRRNNIVDDSISGAIKAVEENNKAKEEYEKLKKPS